MDNLLIKENPGSNDLRIIACPRPFSVERIDRIIPAGARLGEIVAATVGCEMMRLTRAHVFVDDWWIPPEAWPLVRPKPGRVVTIRVVPLQSGGGEGGKSPLRIVLTIAIIAASVYTGGLAAAALGFAQGTIGAAVASAVVGAVVGAVGNMLVNAIAPPPKPRMEAISGVGTTGNTQDSPTFAIEGATNAARLFGVIPRVVGEHRMVPPKATKTFTELVGDDQYVRELFCFGYGPLKIEVEKIGETPIGDFVEVESEFRRGFQPAHLTDRGAWDASVGTFPTPAVFGDWYTASVGGTVGGVPFEAGDTIVYQALGAGDQDAASWDKDGNKPLTLIPNIVDEKDFSIALTQAASWQQRTTEPDTDEISVENTFPGGLVTFDNAGNKGDRAVTVEIEYSPAGANTWTAVEPLAVTGRRTSAIRAGRRWKVARGQYDVRQRRTTPDTTSSQIADDTFWTKLRSITNEDPVLKPGMCLMAKRIKATGQLNGSVAEYNAVATSIIEDWDTGTGAWILRPTRNPASVYRTILQDEANARPVADSRIDLSGLEAWHAENAAAGRNCDLVVDYGASVPQCLADAAAVGRAAPFRPDGKWGVAVDRNGLAPVQHFTPRNSWGYSFRIVYPDIPHGFRCRFLNREKAYRQDERIVYRDGFTRANATEFAGLELAGITDPGAIWADARYHMADLELRREEHSWFCDVEHIVCTRGDRVLLTHDVPEQGLASGRIKATVLDGGGNVTGLTVDEILPMELGKSYGIAIRTTGEVGLVAEAVTDPGEQTTITLAAAIPAAQAPKPDDLFGFGELGQETLELVVKGIEAGKDWSARILARDAAEAVHDSGELPRDFAPGSVTPATDTISVAGHAFFDEDEIRFSSDGTLPAGLSAATTYYVVGRTADTFQVSETSGGAAVDITDGGTGTHTAARQIPAFVSTLSVAPGAASPGIISIRSGGEVLHRSPDGSLESRILVTFAPPSGLRDDIVGAEASYRVLGSAGAWLQTAAAAADAGELSILPVEDGETYELMLRWTLRGGGFAEWGAPQTHIVEGKTAVPSDVATLAAQQNGNVVTFKWPQIPDLDRAGYVLRYAAQGAFTWAAAALISEETKGTLITNAALPPGNWTVGIKARDTSGNESANATTFDIVVANANDVVATAVQAPRWPGGRTGLVKHDVSGRLVPESNALASAMTDAELWDRMVHDPVAVPVYEAPEIDLGFDADGSRVWANAAAAIGPGETGNPVADLQIDYRDEGGAYDGFEDWTIGTADFRRIKARVELDTSQGVAWLSAFTPTVDVPEHTDKQAGIAIAPGGSTVAFGRTFHGPPNIQVSAEETGGAARYATWSNVTSTTVDLKVWDSGGVDVGGNVNLTATGA